MGSRMVAGWIGAFLCGRIYLGLAWDSPEVGCRLGSNDQTWFRPELEPIQFNNILIWATYG